MVFDKSMYRTRILLTILAVLAAAVPVRSAETTIAVAANFATAATEIVNRFEADHDHQVILVIGSTGKLASQILHGAPYDALLAADQERPALLEGKGMTVEGSKFSYARGRLALMASTEMPPVTGLRSGLLDPKVRHVALANDKLAPYGRAAREVLRKLGLEKQLEPALIVGESVGQVFGIVKSGNAELGFVSYSQVQSPAKEPAPAFVAVAADLHAPILQDGVLLTRARDNPAAKDFMAYLQTPDARAIMRKHGYEALP